MFAEVVFVEEMLRNRADCRVDVGGECGHFCQVFEDDGVEDRFFGGGAPGEWAVFGDDDCGD